MNNWISSSPRPELQMKMYSEFIGGDKFENYVKNEELEKLIIGKKNCISWTISKLRRNWYG